ncbi:myosin-7 [Biomphalaria glabrata]|nr:myosin-7 [Biomphalaria glabrata]
MPTTTPATMQSISIQYITKLFVLCLLTASDADLVMKIEPKAIRPDSNENLTICCSITNNTVEHLKKLSHLTLARLNKDFDPLVSLYINDSRTVERAPLLDADRCTITFGKTDFCLTVKNVTTYEVTYYRCEAHGYDASHTKQKINYKLLVTKLPTELINDRSKGPGMNSSTSFNQSESERVKEYKHQESESCVFFSVFEARPRVHSQLMGDNKSISGSRRLDDDNAALRVSLLWSVILNREELIASKRTCIDQMMYFLGQFNQSLFGVDHVSSLDFNSSSATKTDQHACTSNESQHSFFGIIGSKLDMRLVCAFNLDKIYVFFSAILSPFEIGLKLSTYKSKNSIENVLNDLLLCVENLKSESLDLNLQDKIFNTLNSIMILNEQRNSETQSVYVNVTLISKDRYCSIEYNTIKNSSLENNTSTEQMQLIIELFKSFLTKIYSDNIRSEKELLTVLLKLKDEHVLTKQTVIELLNTTEYKLKGELMETYTFNKYHVQTLRNYSALKKFVQELNNSLQENVQNYLTLISATDNFTQQFKQELENLSKKTFDMISKIQNQTKNYDLLQQELNFKIENIEKNNDNANLTHLSDFLHLHKLLQLLMNQIDGLKENVSDELFKTKERIDNLKQHLEEVNSVRETIQYDLRNVNVTIRAELTQLSAISQNLKEDFIKFVNDLKSHRNHASVEHTQLKEIIRNKEELLKELDSESKSLEHDIRNINVTILQNLTTLSESSQNLKQDFIKFLKDFNIYSNRSFLENTQLKDRIDNQEELLKELDSDSKSLEHDIRNINVTIQQNLTTLSESSQNLKQDFIKFVKDFDIYLNRSFLENTQLKDRIDKQEELLKELDSDSKSLEHDIRNINVTIQQNLTTLSESSQNLKQDFIKFVKDFDIYLNRSFLENTQLKDRIDKQEELLKELDSDSKSLEHDIQNINVTILQNLTTLSEVSQNLKQDFIKFVKDFDIYSNRSFLENKQIKDRIENQEVLLKELDSDRKSLEHDIRNINVTILQNLTTLSEVSQNLKQDFIKFVKDFDIYSNRSFLENKQIKDRIENQEVLLKELDSDRKSLEHDIRNINVTILQNLTTLSESSQNLKQDFIKFVKDFDIYLNRSFLENTQLKDRIDNQEELLKELDSDSKSLEHDIRNINVTIQQNLTTLSESSQNLKQDFIKFVKDFDIYLNRSFVENTQLKDRIDNQEELLKELDSDSKSLEHDIRNINVTIQQNLTTLSESSQNLKQDFIKFLKDFDIYSNQSFLENTQLKDRIENQEVLLKELDSDSKSLEHDIRNINVTILQNLTTLSESSQNLKQDFIKFLKDFNIYSNRSFLENTQLKDRIDNQEDLLKELDSDSKILEHDIRNINVTILHNLTTLSESSQNLKQDFIKFVKDFDIYSNRSFLENKQLKDRIENQEVLLKELDSDSKSLEHDIRNINVTILQNLTTLSESSQNLKQDFIKFLKDFNIYSNRSFLENTQLKDRIDNQEDLLKELDSDSKILEHDIRNINVTILHNLTTLSESSQNLKQDFIKFLKDFVIYSNRSFLENTQLKDRIDKQEELLKELDSDSKSLEHDIRNINVTILQNLTTLSESSQNLKQDFIKFVKSFDIYSNRSFLENTQLKDRIDHQEELLKELDSDSKSLKHDIRNINKTILQNLTTLSESSQNLKQDFIKFNKDFDIYSNRSFLENTQLKDRIDNQEELLKELDSDSKSLEHDIRNLNVTIVQNLTTLSESSQNLKQDFIKFVKNFDIYSNQSFLENTQLKDRIDNQEELLKELDSDSKSLEHDIRNINVTILQNLTTISESSQNLKQDFIKFVKDFDIYSNRSILANKQFKDRIENQEELLKEIDSDSKSLEHDIRNINVTIQRNLTTFSESSQNLKQDFIKFFKDFDIYSNRSFLANKQFKDRIENQEELLKELDSDSKSLQHDIRNINVTIQQNLTTLSESSQNLKQDFIKFVKDFEIYSNRSFLENTQLKDRIDNQEELLKELDSDSKSLEHDIRNINVTILQNLTTISESSQNLKQDFIKFVKDFDIYSNRSFLENKQIKDRIENQEVLLKELDSDSKSLKHDIRNINVTILQNLTTLSESSQNLKQDFIKFVKDFDIYSNRSFLENKQIKDRIDNYNDLFKELDSDSKSLEHDIRNINVTILQNLTTLSESSQNLKQDFIKFVKNFDIYSNQSFLENTQLKDRIDNQEELLKELDSDSKSLEHDIRNINELDFDSKSLEHDIRNINVTFLQNLTTLSESSQNLKQDFIKFVKDFDIYSNRSILENKQFKDRIENQEVLLKELDSDSKSLEHDIRNINVTIQRNLTTLSESSQNLKQDFIKFCKDFEIYSNRSFLENTQLKDRIDNQEELLKELDSDSKSLEHDIRNINVTILQNLTTISESSQNLKQDFIKFVKDFVIYSNRSFLENKQIKDRIENQEVLLKELDSDSKSLEHDIRNINVTILQNLTTLSESSQNLKQDFIKFLKDFDIYSNRSFLENKQIKDRIDNYNDLFKELDFDSKSLEHDIRNINVTILQNLTTLSESSQNLKQDFIKFVKDFDIYSNRSFLENTQLKDRIDNQEELLKELDSDSKSLEHDIRNINVTILQNLTTISESSQNLKQDFIKFVKDFDIYSNRSFLENKQIKDRIENQEVLLKELDSDSKSLKHDIRNINVTILQNLTTLSESSQNLKQDFIKFVKDFDIYSNRSFLENKQIKDRIDNYNDLFKELDSDSKSLEHDIRNINVTILQNLTTLSESSQNLKQDFIKFVKDFDIYSNRSFLENTQLKDRIDNQEELLKELDSDSKSLEHDIRNINVTILQNLTTLSESSQNLKQDFIKFVKNFDIYSNQSFLENTQLKDRIDNQEELLKELDSDSKSLEHDIRNINVTILQNLTTISESSQNLKQDFIKFVKDFDIYSNRSFLENKQIKDRIENQEVLLKELDSDSKSLEHDIRNINVTILQNLTTLSESSQNLKQDFIKFVKDFEIYSNRSFLENTQLKDRIDNQEELLKELDSDSKSLEHDIRNINVTILQNLTTLSESSQNLKQDFIKFVKDFDIYSNRSFLENKQIKDRIENQEELLKELDSDSKSLEHDIRNINVTILQNLTTLSESSQNL